MPEVDIEILPILIAGIIPMVVGSIWYSPLLFANYWMKLSGVKEVDLKAVPVTEYLLSTLTSLILSFVLFHFFNYAEVSNNFEALQLALWVWLGFAIPFVLPGHLFDRRPWGLFFIYAGYQLVNLVLMALVFANL